VARCLLRGERTQTGERQWLTSSRRNGGKEVVVQEWDPFAAMREWLRWDPFREMARSARHGAHFVLANFDCHENKDGYVFKADVRG